MQCNAPPWLEIEENLATVLPLLAPFAASVVAVDEVLSHVDI